MKDKRILEEGMKKLFPEIKKSNRGNYYINECAYLNLLGAYIELKEMGTDKICLKTINRVLHQLKKAKKTWNIYNADEP